MWMLSINDQGNIWVVMNNLIRRSRQGIMIPNAQQNFKMRTPALNFYTLSKLHMTSQWLLRLNKFISIWYSNFSYILFNQLKT